MKKNKTKTRRKHKIVKKRGGEAPIQHQYNIKNWDSNTTEQNKAATMNVFANTSKDFMTRQGVTAADQKTHLDSILGKIYNQGFAKLPGDTTNNYDTAYQKAIEPLDTTNIEKTKITGEEFKQAHENALKNVESSAETKEEKQEIRDSNEQVQQFNDLEKQKKISKEDFFNKFPNRIRHPKSAEQIAKEQRFLRNKKAMSQYNTPRKLSSKEYAKIYRGRQTRRIRT